jgi:hypothetical protein
LVTFQQHTQSVKHKEFLCLNRAWRDNRLLFLLSQQHNLHLGNVSFLAVYEDFGDTKLLRNRMLGMLDGVRSQQHKQQYEAVIDAVLSKLPMTLQVDQHSRDSNNQNNPDINQLRKSVWYEIVNETYHNISEDAGKFAVITEKSFWPILNQMPFVNVGYKMNHCALTQLGFRDFREDFDIGEFQGPIWERLDKLDYAINRLAVMSADDKLGWLHNMQHKITHNFNHLVKTDWWIDECQQLIAAVR